MAICVLVVNHQDIVCESLAARLSAEEDIEVVAACFSGREAVVKARALRPHVVVIDYSLAGPLSALETIIQLKQIVPDCQVIVLSDFMNGEVILRSFRSGASNYVLKDASVQRLVECIRQAYAGRTPLDPVVGRLLVEEIALRESEHSLTPTELQVVHLLADGLTNNEIARRLYISPSTAKRHVSAAYHKLGVANRREAVERAKSRGLIVGR